MAKSKPTSAPTEKAYTPIGAHRAIEAVAQENEGLRRQLQNHEERLAALEKKRK